MKIIGKTTKGYILEATEDEVANLKGFYSNYHTLKVDESVIGQEIEIKKIYNRYRAFEDLIKSSKLNDALATFTAIIDVLTPVEELFKQTKEIIK